MKYFVFFIQVLFALSLSGQVIPQRSINVDLGNLSVLTYHPKGNLLFLGGDSKGVLAYDLTLSKGAYSFGEFKGEPRHIAVNQQGSLLAVAIDGGGVEVFDLQQQERRFFIKDLQGEVKALVFSPEGDVLITAGEDNTIAYWDAFNGAIQKKIKGHYQAITDLAIVNNGNLLVSGAEDGQIIFWDIKTGQAVKRVRAHGDKIRALAVSPNGALLASGGDDSYIHVWDVVSGERVSTFRQHAKRINCLEFSSDGAYLLSAGRDKYVVLTELSSGKIVFRSAKQNNPVDGIAFNPVKWQFASYTQGAEGVQLWKLTMVKSFVKAQKAIAANNTQSSFKPQIAWKSSLNSSSVSKSSVRLEADIFSESSLRSIKLFQNNKLIDELSRSDLMLKTAEQENTTYENLVILQQGNNQFYIEVENIAGVSRSEVLNLAFDQTPKKPFKWIYPDNNYSRVNQSRYQVSARIPEAEGSQKVSLIHNGKVGSTTLFPPEGGMFNQFVTLNQGDNSLKFKLETGGEIHFSQMVTLNYYQVWKPEIKWMLPLRDTLSEVKGNTVMFQVFSNDEISRLEIFVNDLSVYFKTNIKEHVLTVSQHLQLSYGLNTIRVEATNSAGKVVSEERKITIENNEETSISWHTPALAVTNSYKKEFEIKACLKTNSIVHKVEVLQNLRSVYVIEPNKKGQLQDCDVLIKQTLSLENGENDIQILAYTDDKISQSEVRNIRFSEALPAKITWKKSSGKLTTESDRFLLDACIESNCDIEELSLILNQNVFKTVSYPKMNNGACAYHFEQEIPLNNGENTAKLLVRNLQGETQSEEVLIHKKSGNPYRFALIIGNEDYSSYQVELQKESDVDYAINDASAFKKAAVEYLNVPSENILYYENARYLEMRKAIKKIQGIMEVTQGKSEIFVYYAGHGYPDELTKEPYLIPVDGSGTDLEFSAIKLSMLYESLTKFPSQRVTVFLDACFSGAARNQGLIAARGVRIVPRKPQEAVKKTLVVFSASSGDQAALAYSEKEQGMFTHYLLKKLEDAQGQISYKALSEYLEQEVAIRSMMVNGVRQIPQVNVSSDIEGEWELWKFE